MTKNMPNSPTSASAPSHKETGSISPNSSRESNQATIPVLVEQTPLLHNQPLLQIQERSSVNTAHHHHNHFHDRLGAEEKENCPEGNRGRPVGRTKVEKRHLDHSPFPLPYRLDRYMLDMENILVREESLEYKRFKGLTESQHVTLKEFRNRVQGLAPPHQLQDHFLLQWLTARDFSVKDAENMFRKSQEWRKELDLEHILEFQPPEVLLKYCPMSFLGYDKYGGAALLIPHGRVDIKGLLHSCTEEEYIRYTIMTVEKIKRLMDDESERRGYPVCQLTVVFDMEYFSYFDFIHPPAPSLFKVAYRLIKPFLHPATRDKVQIYGGRSEWQHLVIEDIGPKILPKYWGGERVDADGDEMCESVVCMGGRVPKHYYLESKLKNRGNQAKTIVLHKKEEEKIMYKITETNSVLRWQFDIEDLDICFGIERKGLYLYSTEPAEVILPLSKVDAHEKTECGEVICEKPGRYYFIFDNKYSYFRSKTIHYTIELLLPL